ncbi:hypothetical protein EBR04_09780 [bacterium]|nr:hypothetical protein [bacterium]
MTIERLISGLVGGVLTVSGAASATAGAPVLLTAEVFQIAIGALLLGYTLGSGAAARQTIAAAVQRLLDQNQPGGSGGGGDKSGGAA